MGEASVMRQLGMLDADFLHKEAAHFDSNITLIKIYDQSTAPAGKVRLKSLLAHVESRLDLSPIFRSKLQPTPLGVDLPLWEIYVMEGQDGFHDLPAGSFALLVKVHYAAVDVDRGADISTLLHDTTQRTGESKARGRVVTRRAKKAAGHGVFQSRGAPRPKARLSAWPTISCRATN